MANRASTNQQIVDQNQSKSDSEVISLSPMENSLVVRRILSHFNTQELLKLSTVNKLWNHEARCLLRDNRKCEALIMGTACARAKLLNDDIDKMKVVPINSLNAWMLPHQCPPEFLDRSIEDVYPNLINKLDLRQLKLYWFPLELNGEVKCNESCVFAKLLLQFLSGLPKLERLEIMEGLPRNLQLGGGIKSAQASAGFPKLRALKVPRGIFGEDLANPVIQDLLINRTPALQVLENPVTPDLLKFFPLEKYGAIREMDFYQTLKLSEEVLNLMSSYIKKGPRLQEVHIYQPGQDFDTPWELQRQFWTILWDILRSSCDTLTSVAIDPYSLATLVKEARRLGFWPRFEKATKLSIHVPNRGDTGINATVSGLWMQDIFPAVTEVSFIKGDYIDWVAMAPIGQRIPWPAITKLTVQGGSSLNPVLRDIGPLFPSVSSLVLSGCPFCPNEQTFRLLWNTWPDLKHLDIGKLYGWKISGWYENYDAVFCGIHPDEAALLLEMDDDYLKAVNIVPPFPAINHLKDLKELQIGFSSIRFKTEPVGTSDSFFLSKVTRFVAMRQLEDFNFHLIGNSKTVEYLEHLKPWVKLEVKELGDGDEYPTDDEADLE